MRPRRAALAALAAIVSLAGCASWSSRASEVSGRALDVADTTGAPAGASSTSSSTTAVAASCDSAASYAPLEPHPRAGAMPAGSTMAEIVARGRLEAGVDENTLLLGYRDPISNELRGYEVDLLREVARALFGDPTRVEFKTVNTEQKTKLVSEGKVDITASAVSMTCSRWRTVAFSAPYHRATQKVMVRGDSPIASISDLDGKTVCVTKGSTSLGVIQQIAPTAVSTQVETRTECLALLQAGEVDAIFTHDTFLLGFQLQDSNTRILPQPLSEQLYGMAVNPAHIDLVRFVNGVLADLEASGRLAELYRANFLECDRCAAIASDLPPEPPVPAPNYGRG